MKFIRDIIADKRDQVPAQGAQVAEPRSDHDVMASILTEATPAVAPTPQAFRLDSSFQVPEPQIEEPPVHAEPEIFAEPELADYSDDEDHTDALIAGLAGLGCDDSDNSADFSGPEPDTFDAPSPLPEVSVADEVPQRPTLQQGFEDDEPADVDFQRLAASVAAQEEVPQQRSFKRFTRTQTRLHTPEVDEPEDHTVTPESAIHQEPVEPAQPAPLRQHPAPIRQRATPEMPPVVAPEPTMEPPHSQPQAPVQPAARERVVTAEPGQPIDVPSPAMGRGSSRAGRVKTRLLGFNPGQAAGADPFADKGKTSENAYTQFPVGWLAVIKGPGRGATYTLFSGVTVIGRGEDQTVRLDFGDNSISRDNHAAIAFDAEKNAFFIGHGGKANLVRRNDRPVLSTEELGMGDLIRIGETTLRFVPLCGPEFGWNEAQQSDAGHAS